MVCGGCGAVVPVEDPWPYRCPAASTDSGAGSDVDHVLAPRVGGERGSGADEFVFGSDENPFRRYGDLLLAKAFLESHGKKGATWEELVTRIDDAVALVDGRGFQRTPYASAAALAEALGFSGVLWIKDETGNVAGSHKARHLMGVALHQEAAAQSGHGERAGLPLAVASCGNAALAAAVIARAWSGAEACGTGALGGCGELVAFVPVAADRRVLARLGGLGATVATCERGAVAGAAGGGSGDPCLPAFREAVEAGALPFTCQGSENGLVLDGGRTLGFEIAEQHGEASGKPLDRIFIQVGGGALASAVSAGLRVARGLGACACAAGGPALHPVQTTGCSPLYRAWKRLVDGVEQRVFETGHGVPEPVTTDREVAAWLVEHAQLAEQELAYAAKHRSEFMWPWEVTPHSAAAGILDDETWDWLTILKDTVRSGGWPLVVPEESLRLAVLLGQEHTDIPVDATGAAGLAGLMMWLEEYGQPNAEQTREQVAVIFTGGLGLSDDIDGGGDEEETRQSDPNQMEGKS